MKIIKVTSKGQVTLPRALREKLSIIEGSYLEASISQNGILLKPSTDYSELIGEHCRQYASSEDNLNKTREVLSKLPFSLSKQSSRLRDE